MKNLTQKLNNDLKASSDAKKTLLKSSKKIGIAIKKIVSNLKTGGKIILCGNGGSAADAMIHLAWLDHCPNVVVEALSQDCPVICTDSGGTKEILGDGGYIVSESQKYNFELLDYDSPYDLDLSCLREVDVSRLEVDKSKIDLLKVADKYEKVLAGR